MKPAAEQVGFYAIAPRRVRVAPMADVGQNNVGRSGLDEIATPKPVIESRVSIRGTSVIVAQIHMFSTTETGDEYLNTNF